MNKDKLTTEGETPGEKIFKVLNNWVYNDMNTAGDQLSIIDGHDFPKIMEEIETILTQKSPKETITPEGWINAELNHFVDITHDEKDGSFTWTEKNNCPNEPFLVAVETIKGWDIARVILTESGIREWANGEGHYFGYGLDDVSYWKEITPPNSAIKEQGQKELTGKPNDDFFEWWSHQEGDDISKGFTTWHNLQIIKEEPNTPNKPEEQTGIDLDKLSDKIDKALDNETDESLTKWLTDQRNKPEEKKEECPECNGTKKMDVDYHDDNDVTKITTIQEPCLLCEDQPKEQVEEKEPTEQKPKVLIIGAPSVSLTTQIAKLAADHDIVVVNSEPEIKKPLGLNDILPVMPTRELPIYYEDKNKGKVRRGGNNRKKKKRK